MKLKNLSRLTALLLAFILTFSVVAEATPLSDLTADQLNTWYMAVAKSETFSYEEVLGISVNLTWQPSGGYSGYSYQWYHLVDDNTRVPLASASEEEPYKLIVTVTLEAQSYFCIATDNDGKREYSSRFVVSALPPENADVYLNELNTIKSEKYAESPVIDYRFEAYRLMTDTWNVKIDGVNLAKAIMLAFDKEIDGDLLCTCCINTAEDGTITVSDDILHQPYGQHAEGCPWYEGSFIVPPIPEQPTRYKGEPNGNQYISDETYTLPMTRAIILPESGRATIHSGAEGGYNWQVYDGANWVDMDGETSADLMITTAKLQTIFNLTGIAQLRYYDKANSIVLASVDVTSQAIAGGEYPEEENTTAQNFVLQTRGGGDETPSTYNVVVNFLFENNAIAADSYTASLAAGSNFNTTVTFPTVLGYLPYLDEVQKDSLDLSIEAINTDHIYNVVYKPTNVNYTVIHYQQNLDDDKYTKAECETKQGLTNSIVPEVAKTYDGFYKLLYEKPAIAADGSTVVEVYYDRYYYLMNFDLDGGYGVEPIYARYDAPISVGTPTKAGYEFMGWSLDGTTIVKLPTTMPASSQTYIAVWGNPELVNYTIVYWKENADDDNYSFWGSEIRQITAGSTVSGSDSIPSSITTTTVEGSTEDERKYFTYNGAKTDKNVTINGDGSSVVNVYYTRNYYTILFTGYGKCALTEHTHSDACRTLVCGYSEEHTHNEDCIPTLTCTIPEHTHSDECCSKAEHTHTTSCYDNVGDLVTANSQNLVDAPTNPVDGQVYKRKGNNYNRVIYINGSWYLYNNNNAQTETIVQPNSSCPGVHTHGDGTCTCDQVEHTHDDSCYTYSCGYVQHVHTDDCYRYCTLTEHTHTNTCTTNNADNVIYVLTAKYEQNIADVWPTYDVLKNGGYAYVDSDGNVENKNGYRFRGWDVDGVSSEAVSKRVTMTTDLCDTSDGVKYAVAQYETTYYVHLYYMFESFDQTSPENGNERKYYNGKYYDKSEAFYQDVYANSDTFGQKKITGMTAVGVVSTQVTGNEYNNFLYYDRNRSALVFQNIDTEVKSVSGIMFEQPLKEYRDSEGNLLSEFIPDYPSTLEPNAYEFAGWYTTPECYEGTEFDFSTATMPNGDLTLYAYWKPITHTVRFYLDKDAMEADTEDNDTELRDPVTVPHGSKVDPVPEKPENGSYTFVGWFYMENGVEKAFDFANMPVTKDLQVYGKWSSNVLKQYTIYYKYKDDEGNKIEIADPTTGSGLAGVTKTFEAKGGAELYDKYQEGYFPVVKSHSMTIDINATEENDTNVYTFWYVQKEAVPYTVKYLNKKTGEPVATEKTVSDNRKAVVTETFVPVSGYLPDAYQKRLVVSAEEGAVNEIIFYYTEDTTHAYYKITHYTENLGTDADNNPTWTEYASSQAVGDIGTTYTADPMTIPGFTYDSTVEGTVASGELTANGLELKLYYTRNSYPYKVLYLEQGTGNQLAVAKADTGKYGQVISESAIDITNYTPVDPTSQTLTIRIETDEVAKLNIITFYYTENVATINYVVVGPEGCGTVSPISETLKVLTGTAQGSTATASSNTYKFVGWYSDAACSNLLSTDAKYVPTKETGAAWQAATYYAKFEYNLTTLTITKMGMDSNDAGQSFLFKVVGPNLPTDGLLIAIYGNGIETISGLLVGGEYTVTEVEDWSWRYSASERNITLAASGNEVTIENKRDHQYWLDGDCYAENVFNAQTGN